MQAQSPAPRWGFAVSSAIYFAEEGVDVQRIISENQDKIAELCRTHHVRRLSVFGSAVREDFDPATSDVDLLVDFEELPYPASVENLWSLRELLIELFDRPVDLIREGSVRNPYLLREILADQEMLYAA